MFTNFKQKEGIFVNGVGIFVILFVCVCARASVCVSMLWGRWVNALSFQRHNLPYQPKWSNGALQYCNSVVYHGQKQTQSNF